MLFTLKKRGNSYCVFIPKGFVDHFSKDGQIELHFGLMSREEQDMVERAEPIEPPKDSDPKSVEEIPMSKEEKIEALRNLIEMGGNKGIEEKNPALASPIDDDEVVYDADEEIPEEHQLKPGFEGLRGKKQ